MDIAVVIHVLPGQVDYSCVHIGSGGSHLDQLRGLVILLSDKTLRDDQICNIHVYVFDLGA